MKFVARDSDRLDFLPAGEPWANDGNYQFAGPPPHHHSRFPSIGKTMRKRLAIDIALGASVIAASLIASDRVRASSDPTRIAFDVPRDAVVMGDDIAHTEWPVRLARPSREGQFEVLVRKTATPIQAPGCKSPFLVVRMPASVEIGHDLAIQTAIRQKRELFDRMMDAYANGRPMHFDVFAGPYGHRAANGQVTLSGCNIFFEEPVAPQR